MNRALNTLHPEFRLDGVQLSFGQLVKKGQELIEHGRDFEVDIGEFLKEWLSEDQTIAVSTSGSTGTPKIIHLSKSSMIHSARNTAAYFGLKEGASALLCLSARNIAGKMMLVRSLVMGWNLYCVPPSSKPLHNMERHFDFAAMVPMQLHNSLKQIEHIDTLIVGGATLNRELFQALQSVKTRVYATYGMTETSSHIALRPVNQSLRGSDEPLFTCLPDISIHTDHRGCLVIRAPYIGEKEIITNDLVEIKAADRFIWLGRWDHIINSGGVKLIPERIENKIRSIVTSQFILVGLPDPILGEQMILVIEGQDRESNLLDRIKEAAILDTYEIPKAILMLKEFPRTETGKIKRKKVAQFLQS